MARVNLNNELEVGITTSNSSVSTNKHTVTYALFLYHEELRRRKTRYMRLNKTKILLTHNLVSQGIKNLKYCSIDDINAIRREMLFKQKLKKQLKRIKQLEKLGIENPNPNALTTVL